MNAAIAEREFAEAETYADKRKSPRYQVNGKLLGHIQSLNLPVSVRDLSFGGFAIETPKPLAANLTHRVRFTADGGWATTLTALAVYSRPSCGPDGLPLYVTGFMFLNEPGRDTNTIVRYMVEKITSVGLFR